MLRAYHLPWNKSRKGVLCFIVGKCGGGSRGGDLFVYDLYADFRDIRRFEEQRAETWFTSGHLPTPGYFSNAGLGGAQSP